LSLEKEYELILDTYEVLSLELDNTTLTKEILTLKKAQYENNKITLEDWLNVQKKQPRQKLGCFG
jgi:myosin-crossreactive antigen